LKTQSKLLSKTQDKSENETIKLVANNLNDKNKYNDKHALSAKKNAPNDPSPFSFFYSFVPKEILGVPLNEIKKDLKEGSSQISTL
jgi:hypothetical protein